MRAVIVIGSPNFFGGGGRFACDLALGLLERNVELAVCAFENPLRGVSHEGFFRIEKWVIPRFRWNVGKLYKIIINQRYSLERLVRKFNPDVIIGADTEPGVMGGIKTKKIMYVHFPTEGKIYKHSLIHEIYRSIYWWQHHKAIKELDAIVCNSEYTNQITRLIWGGSQPNMDRYSVIQPCVDVEKFKIKAERDPFKLCYVGRIDENKGINYVIDAFKKVKTKVPKAKLEIVGGVKGSPWAERYYPELLLKVKGVEGITVKIDVQENEIIETLSTSRCMASYNPGEHFGIVPIEAMAAGCPPVVANGGGQRETVIDGETGFLLNSPEEMELYLLRLLGDDELFKTMSEKARIRAREFGRVAFTDKWMNLLNLFGS